MDSPTVIPGESHDQQSAQKGPNGDMAWRILRHRFELVLRTWPANSAELPGLIEQIREYSRPLAQDGLPELEQMEAVCSSSKIKPADCAEAFKRLERALQPRPLIELPASKLLDICRRLDVHWSEGLLPHLQAFRAQLADQPENAFRDQLQAWCKKYPEANFKRAAGLRSGAQALAEIVTVFKSTTDFSLLSPLLHRTINQHLSSVLNSLNAHEAAILDFSGERSLQLAHLPGLIERLSHLAETTHAVSKRDAQSEVPEQASPDIVQAAGQRQMILILEDDPVWNKALIEMSQQVLEQFFQLHYGALPAPERAKLEARWEIRSCNHIRAAEELVSDAGLLISDLTLPVDDGGEPEREHGIDFLKNHLVSRLRTLPVMVHSSSTAFLTDLAELRALGIRDRDLILKQDPECQDLRACLLKWLHVLRERDLGKQGQQHKLEFRNGSFALDKILLQLSPRSQALLHLFYQRALSKNRTLSSDEIHAHIFPIQQANTVLDARRERIERFVFEQPDADTQVQLESVLDNLIKHWDAFSHSGDDFPFDMDENPYYRWNRFLDMQPWLAKQIQQQALETRLLLYLGQSMPEFNAFAVRERLSRFLTNEIHQSLHQHTSQVSDWIYRLKSELLEAFRACGKSLRPDEIISAVDKELGHAFEVQKYRLSAGINVLAPKGQPRPEQWRILLVENNRIWANDIMQEVERFFRAAGLAHELRHARYVDEVLELSDGWAPDLLLLDLHLPLTKADYDLNQDDGVPEAGYLAWTKLRALGYAPRVLVTSSLADDYLLRRIGVNQALDSRDFLLKGKPHQGVEWPECFSLQLKRVLDEIALDALLPAQKPGPSLLDELPLEVEVLYYGSKRLPGGKASKQIELELAVKAATAEGEIQVRVCHAAGKAVGLAYLLARWESSVSLEEWGQVLNGNQPGAISANAVHKKRDQIRKDINASWPIGWLKHANPAKVILRQRDQGFSLNVRRVLDPTGALSRFRDTATC